MSEKTPSNKDIALAMFNSGLFIEDIYKKFPHINKSTIRNKWLKGLVKRRDCKNELINYYNQKTKQSSDVPVINNIAAELNMSITTVTKYLSNLIEHAPEDGIYQKTIDGKTQIYLTIPKLKELLSDRYSCSHLQNIFKREKIARISLIHRNGRTCHYSLQDILDKIPKIKQMIDQLQVINQQTILRKKPPNLTDQEYLTLVAIIIFQETYKKKPTHKQIYSILKIFNFSFYQINEKMIAKLKNVKYIDEKKDIYIICRGPRELLLKRGSCLDPETGLIKNMYHPRIFTATDWEITERPTREEYNENSKTRFIHNLIEIIKYNNNK